VVWVEISQISISIILSQIKRKNNMVDQTVAQTAVNMDDPWDVADNAKPRDYEYYGQVKADVWFGHFPGGGVKPIPFDAAIHPADKRTTMIDIQIIPIAEQSVTFEVRQNYTDFSLDWTKITLPSIKALGVDGLRSLNGHFVRVAQVDGKREKKEDGAKTGVFYKTFKFLEAFADQAACVKAYCGNAPSHTEQEPISQTPSQSPVNSQEKDSVLKFARVVVVNAARGQKDINIICDSVTAHLSTMPMINKYFTATSPEIMTMIMEEAAKNA
jgi:hypothetical protein